MVVTVPPTHSVGGQTCNSRWCLSSVGVCNTNGGPAGGFICAGQAITSIRLQSNYSSIVILHGGPILLCLVRATPCLYGDDSGSILLLLVRHHEAQGTLWQHVFDLEKTENTSSVTMWLSFALLFYTLHIQLRDLKSTWPTESQCIFTVFYL